MLLCQNENNTKMKSTVDGSPERSSLGSKSTSLGGEGGAGTYPGQQRGGGKGLCSGKKGGDEEDADLPLRRGRGRWVGLGPMGGRGGESWPGSGKRRKKGVSVYNRLHPVPPSPPNPFTADRTEVPHRHHHPRTEHTLTRHPQPSSMSPPHSSRASCPRVS